MPLDWYCVTDSACLGTSRWVDQSRTCPQYLPRKDPLVTAPRRALKREEKDERTLQRKTMSSCELRVIASSPRTSFRSGPLCPELFFLPKPRPHLISYFHELWITPHEFNLLVTNIEICFWSIFQHECHECFCNILVYARNCVPRNVI